MLSKGNAGLIDTLRKVVDLIDEQPVWPFDAPTLRKFVGVSLIPILQPPACPSPKHAAFLQRSPALRLACQTVA